MVTMSDQSPEVRKLSCDHTKDFVMFRETLQDVGFSHQLVFHTLECVAMNGYQFDVSQQGKRFTSGEHS